MALPCFLKERRATAATEFALIMPLVVLLFAAIVEFGRIYQVYNATNMIASQFAIVWADCSDSPAGTCQTELGNYTTTAMINNIAPQLNPANLTLQMFEVTMSGSSPSIVYSYPSTATLSAAQTTLAQANFVSGQTGVIVTATYSHSLQFFSTLITPFLGAYLTPTYTIAQLKS